MNNEDKTATLLKLSSDDLLPKIPESTILKNERIGILIAITAQFFWALSVISIKLGSKCGQFNANTFSLWKSLAQMLIAYYLLKQKQIPILKF